MEHRSTIIITAAAVLIAGLAAGWVLLSPGRNEASAAPVVETTDTAAIQNSVELLHLSIATAENFAKQKIYVISAYVKNVSGKPLRTAEVKMVFTDFDGKPIREYSQKVLERNQRPLPPGEQFRFEVRQENMPRGWNYHVPVTEVVKVGY
jgi:archaellin